MGRLEIVKSPSFSSLENISSYKRDRCHVTARLPLLFLSPVQIFSYTTNKLFYSLSVTPYLVSILFSKRYTILSSFSGKVKFEINSKIHVGEARGC